MSSQDNQLTDNAKYLKSMEIFFKLKDDFHMSEVVKFEAWMLTEALKLHTTGEIDSDELVMVMKEAVGWGK